MADGVCLNSVLLGRDVIFPGLRNLEGRNAILLNDKCAWVICGVFL